MPEQRKQVQEVTSNINATKPQRPLPFFFFAFCFLFVSTAKLVFEFIAVFIAVCGSMSLPGSSSGSPSSLPEGKEGMTGAGIPTEALSTAAGFPYTPMPPGMTGEEGPMGEGIPPGGMVDGMGIVPPGGAAPAAEPAPPPNHPVAALANGLLHAQPPPPPPAGALAAPLSLLAERADNGGMNPSDPSCSSSSSPMV